MTENKINSINESLASKETLRPKWNDLCQRLNIFNNQIFFDDITNHYSETHRHYHTLNHINFCLQELEPVKNSLHNPETVELAIWFHDVIYDIGKNNNEEKSAKMAIQFCQKNNLSPEFTKQVEDHILATGDHTLSDNADTNYLIDIDMSILGYSPDDIYKFEEQIYQEYSTIYNRKEYLIGRLGFLSKLKGYNIYKTEYFKNKYGQSSQDNITKTIKNLEDSYFLLQQD